MLATGLLVTTEEKTVEIEIGAPMGVETGAPKGIPSMDSMVTWYTNPLRRGHCGWIVTVTVSLARGLAGTIDRACSYRHRSSCRFADARRGPCRALRSAATCFAHGSLAAAIAGSARMPTATANAVAFRNILDRRRGVLPVRSWLAALPG